MEGKSSDSTRFHFTKTELRDLFTFRPTTTCDTHELLGCECDGSNGSASHSPAAAAAALEVRACQLGDGHEEPSGSSADLGDLKTWQHLLPPVGHIPDDALAQAMEHISFAFVKVHS